MTHSPPDAPKIYHIVHVDRLPSIIQDGFLWPDAEVQRRGCAGTGIGMRTIKQRRLTELRLASHPSLYVGACVPFYFCPRSIMLYVLHKRSSPGLTYDGGQEPIVHLEADLRHVVQWADTHHLRWAFTLSNAGAYHFEDRNDLACLHELDWEAVHARNWGQCKEGKQAEFLVEREFPWQLVSRIGVMSKSTYTRAYSALQRASHRPKLEILPNWYY